MVTVGGRLARVGLPVLTPRLALRLPQLTDVPLLLRYINDPAVLRPLATRRRAFKPAEEVAWVRASRRAAREGSQLHLAITLRDGRSLIGGIGLEVRDWENGRAWCGYWLARPYWHHAYGSEAASAVCDLAFRKLGLHRIDASVFEFNTRSMALLQRLGFRSEGKRREILCRGGHWYDEVEVGLLADEFRPFRWAQTGAPADPDHRRPRGGAIPTGSSRVPTPKGRPRSTAPAHAPPGGSRA